MDTGKMKDNDNVQHFVKFGQKTSMKGLPRALNAENRILRILWTTGFVILLVVCTQQVWFLVRDYLRFQTVSTTEEIPIVLIPPNPNIKLPSMTFCNLDPIKGDPPTNGTPTMDVYVSKLGEVMKCPNCTEEEKILIDNIEVDMHEPHGYYQYIGKNAARLVGHQRGDFIASCNLIVWDGTRILSGRPCGDLLDIFLFQNAMYFNCYWIAFKDPQPDAKFIPVGLSMTFYLDTFRSARFQPPQFDPAFGAGQSSGVLVELNEAGALPLVEPQFRLLQPGTWSDVQFTVSKTVRLPAPYGECEYSRDLPVIRVGDLPLTYAANTCRRYCAAKLIIQRCSCVDPVTAHGLFTANHTVPFCYSLHLPLKEFLDNLKCLEEHKFNIGSHCSNFEFCPEACKRNKYQTRVSQANWPMDTLADSFYDRMIKGKSFEHYFEPYFNKAQCQNEPLCESRMKSLAMQMIRSNFLKTDIYMNADVQIVLKDSEKTTIVNLLSGLGGTLNLWSGISVVVLVELLDLMIKLCGCGGKPKQVPSKKTAANDENDRNSSEMRGAVNQTVAQV